MWYVLAVFILAFGGFCAVLVPLVVRLEVGPVFRRTLTGAVLASAACTMLSVGGAVIASLAGAHALSEWLSKAAIVGAVFWMASWITDVIKSRWAPTRQRSDGQPPGSQ
jgi:hypothetical protein